MCLNLIEIVYLIKSSCRKPIFAPLGRRSDVIREGSEVGITEWFFTMIWTEGLRMNGYEVLRRMVF
jgi:hypothetical protein